MNDDEHAPDAQGDGRRKAIIENVQFGLGIAGEPTDDPVTPYRLFVREKVISDEYDGPALRAFMEKIGVAWLEQVAPHLLAASPTAPKAPPETGEVERNLEAQHRTIEACAQVADRIMHEYVSRVRGTNGEYDADADAMILARKVADAIRTLRPNLALAASPPAPSLSVEAMREAQRIIRWISEAVERADKHGSTEGIWLFANQWRTVLAALSPSALAELTSDQISALVDAATLLNHFAGEGAGMLPEKRMGETLWADDVLLRLSDVFGLEPDGFSDNVRSLLHGSAGE